MALGVVLGLAAAVPAQPLTGTHFPQTGDFQNLSLLGYDFAVVTMNPAQSSSWPPMLDAAQASGIKLVVDAFPPPYTYASGSWSITPSGVQLLNYLQTRADLILAIYGFNEPYSSNPVTSETAPCGYYSAADLRALRSTIQAVWPGVKIYQDLGAPSAWAPGGGYASVEPCVGTKYADQTGVADFVGIWHYPFTSAGYDRAAGLSTLSAEANFVINSMAPAQPVSLDQAYACPTCSNPGLVFPTPAQMLDWNCATRALPLAAVDWYPWRKVAGYTEVMAKSPGVWPLSTPGACGAGVGADAVALSAASGAPFVAPDSYVSIYGQNFVNSMLAALSSVLPSSLGGVSVQITDAAGNVQSAALDLVSPTQINLVMPSALASGQAAITLNTPLGSPLLGTAMVSNTAPSLFSGDGTGTGVAAATAMSVAADGTVSPVPVYQCASGGCSAIPISLSAGSVYLTLYGTGIRHYVQSVQCAAGGYRVPVLYAGAQGQFPGLDQINVGPIPAALAGAGPVTVILTADGIQANTVTVNFQ